MPYGGAPEFTHTSGDGLTGTLPDGIGGTWTVAGFLRLAAGSAGRRYVWRSNTDARSLRLSSDGTLDLRLDGQVVSSRGRRHHR